jgi:hypothetical protein
MSRIRTIKPEFWTDDLVGSLRRDARLLFIATLNFADDEGLLPWSAPFLKGAAFPFDEDVTVADVASLMQQLSDSGIVFTYRAGRSQQSLGYIVNFHKHQKINRPTPSRLSPPGIQFPDARTMYLNRDSGRCHLCGGLIQETSINGVDEFCFWIDHVIPVSQGGTDHPSNVRPAHQNCRINRGSRSVEEYREVLGRNKGTEPLNYPEQVTANRTETITEKLPDRFTESSVSESVISSLTYSLPEGKGKEGKGAEGGKETARSAPPPAAQSSEANEMPIGLSPGQYAAGLLDRCHVPYSAAIRDAAASAIEAYAKEHRIKMHIAAVEMAGLVSAAVAKDQLISDYWFKNGKYRLIRREVEKRKSVSKPPDKPVHEFPSNAISIEQIRATVRAAASKEVM